MIEFKPDSYIVGLWYSENPQTLDNWMCAVWKDKDDERWNVFYRMRYKKDDKIFDSKDEKSWYGFACSGKTQEYQMIKTIDDMQRIGISIMMPKHDRLLIQGGFNDFLEKGKDKKWLHLKIETIQ